MSRPEIPNEVPEIDENNGIYPADCKIHGHNVAHEAGICLHCLQSTNYRIKRVRRNGETNFYFNGQRITADNPQLGFLKPWVKRLTAKSHGAAEQHILRVTDTPGTYGIFMRNNRKNNKLGKCLYIGQSVNVKKRLSYHKNEIITANRYMKTGKGNVANTRKMYFGIGCHELKDLKFVKLLSPTKEEWKKLNRIQKMQLLTFLEQYNMDMFQPMFNVSNARPSDLSKIMDVNGEYGICKETTGRISDKEK